MSNALSRLQSGAVLGSGTGGEIAIPEYTPLSKEGPPAHLVEMVDAREALLKELKEKLADRRATADALAV